MTSSLACPTNWSTTYLSASRLRMPARESRAGNRGRCRNGKYPRRGRWGPVAQRTVPPHGVVLLPPPFDQDLRLLAGVEDLAIQELVPEPPVEELAVAILPGASDLDEQRPFPNFLDTAQAMRRHHRPPIHGRENIETGGARSNSWGTRRLSRVRRDVTLPLHHRNRSLHSSHPAHHSGRFPRLKHRQPIRWALRAILPARVEGRADFSANRKHSPIVRPSVGSAISPLSGAVTWRGRALRFPGGWR